MKSPVCAALFCFCFSVQVLSAGESIDRLRELFHNGRYEEAASFLTRALGEANKADSAEIYFYEASAERVAELSEIKMMEIIRKFPDSPYAERALLRSAVYQFELDNLAKSEHLLRQILKDYLLTPVEPEIRLWLGRNYLERGEFRSARVELQHGINSLPDFPQTPPWIEGELHYWLGETCELAGNTDCARDAFQHVSLLDASDPLAACSMVRLIDVIQKSGDKEEALIWRKRCKDLVSGTILETAVRSSSKKRPHISRDKTVADTQIPDDPERYWIQLGSFSSRSNADNLKQTLREDDLEAEIKRVKVGGRNYYRVRVGPYSSRQQALDMLRQMRDSGVDGRVLSEDR